MVSIIHQGDHQYEVYHSGESIGFITLSRNSFHNAHRYLNLELNQYDSAIAAELFSLLRQATGSPLQVMLYSNEREQICFLTTGGFVCKRRCYEVEATAADLICTSDGALLTAGTSEPAYKDCCQLLYEHYAMTHEAVSPLTASFEQFCAGLPETVVYHAKDGQITHCAFVEDSEIAYVSTMDQESFSSFAAALAAHMLRLHPSVIFECDDCDPAAMALKACFHLPERDSYDTYILG